MKNLKIGLILFIALCSTSVHVRAMFLLGCGGVKPRVDTSPDGVTELMRGNFNLDLDELLKDVNYHEKSSLVNGSLIHLFAIRGSTRIVAFLASKLGINRLDDNEETPLMKTAKYGKHECLTWLIRNEAEVNYADRLGLTALHWAVIGGNVSCVKALLDVIRNVNAVSKDGRTPLDFAKDPSIIELLQLKGCRKSRA